MSLIHEERFERTLEALVSRHAGAARLEAWTFDDLESRREAERVLAAAGVKARIRSAYKPLLHWFLEDADLSGVRSIEVGYPVVAPPANRFLLEAYPLAAMTGDAELSFTAIEGDGLDYIVELGYLDGRKECQRVFAPNHLHLDFVAETVLSPTGWERIDGDPTGHRLETDYERLFASAMRAVVSHDWGSEEPYFDELNVRVRLPIDDQRLPHGEEVLSLREALHEDIYFSLLEVFQLKSARPLGDRGLKPGQIVPEILPSDGLVELCIETRPLSRMEDPVPGLQRLETAERPLSMAQVRAELGRLEGVAFQALSRAGRLVEARYVEGSDVPVMISGGQHANETTGVVGALRAAHVLSARSGAHFTVAPLLNPDGYALHQRLCLDNPRHMHHAARYTALGDDLDYRPLGESAERLGEKRVRIEAERLSAAKLHVNLHGYPSHEWTRPLSGYVPRGFAAWTLPKGFFLIVRHHRGWERAVERLLDEVSSRLGRVPGLLAFNQAQIRCYQIHAETMEFRFINGFPCLVSLDERDSAPITLITEYPDETIYGEAFIAGHTAQMETVLAAYDAFQGIAADGLD
ncbi:peptidase M14 [Halotalea alkalilenta]|uniref:peptidase M14 n=1 Tax=Halotalea alkalilenta TaxID=376489 RepID=UPI0004849029|nr:peptidase M14 [Halotalea alkalilenta]